ncbi:MAG: hypothetical protein LEGION0398_MBIBDBAK_00196 [Legionellaceae bacterium]
MRYPFTPFSSQGLGISYSSLDQIGPVFPLTTFAETSMQCFLNVATGNLVFRDHAVQLPEMSGLVTLGFILNTQESVEKAWRLALVKRFTVLPTPFAQLSQIAVLEEEDGHLTEYTVTKMSPLTYTAPMCGDGTPFVTYLSDTKEWSWYHPKTQLTEIYNAEGYLVRRQDSLGRGLCFFYTAQHELMAVESDVYHRYEINKNANVVEFYLGQDQQLTLLQRHIFDDCGRLSETHIPGIEFKLVYTYQGNTPLLVNVSYQDVKTNTKRPAFQFGYEEMNGSPCIHQVVVGETNETTLNYQHYPSISVTNGFGSETQIILDDKKRISEIKQDNGYDKPSGVIDCTRYRYREQGQLETIIHPDSSEETFSYLMDLGIKVNHRIGLKQETTLFYTPGTKKPSLISIAKKTNAGTLAVTRYIYDTNYDRKGKEHTFLRFEINPVGGVTEYIADKWGNRAKKMSYLNNRYTYLSDPAIPISLEAMQGWAVRQLHENTQLITYEYDNRGQPIRVREYASVDMSGQGIRNSAMGETQYEWNAFGQWTKKTVKQRDTVFATTEKTYDALQRLTEISNPLTQKTRYDYYPNNQLGCVNTYFANGAINEETYNNQGLLDSAHYGYGEDVDVAFLYDLGGRVVTKRNGYADRVYDYYDRQNRLGFTVTACGNVTEYQYDRKMRFTKTIHYANPIDVKKIWLNEPPQKGEIPLASTLINVLQTTKNATQDRVSYEFLNVFGLTHYTVDAENYVVEYRYNAFDQVTTKIAYANPLSSEQLNTLLEGKTLFISYNPLQDRAWHYRYDDNGDNISVQDPAGYVEVYRRNPLGQVIETICYAKPQPIPFIQEPALSPRDAHTFYHYNGRGLCILEQRPQGYIIAHTYNAEGKKSKSTSFFNPTPLGQLALPTPSDYDQITTYTYDLLGRDVKVTYPFHKTVLTAYDEMGNIIKEEVLDNRADEHTIDPDKRRRTLMRYGQNGLLSAKADERVAEVLAIIEENPNLSPQEKENQERLVWETQSVRYQYDKETKQLLSVENAFFSTHYEYDLDHRLISEYKKGGDIVIDSFEYTLNAFNEIEVKHAIYSNNTKENDDTPNESNDRITHYTRDKKGFVIAKIDPAGFMYTYTANAFLECIKEGHPILEKNPSLFISHEYNPRGQEIKTTRTASDLTTVVIQEYQHYLGKLTRLIDEVGGQYDSCYDNEGCLLKTSNPLSITTATYTYDAFNRVTTLINALQEKTTYQYDPNASIESEIYPNQFAKKITEKNIFDEIITVTDSLGLSESWQHNPDGQITQHINGLGIPIATYTYNTVGDKTRYQDGNGVLTEYQYACQQLILKKKGEQRYRYTWNSFKEQTSVTLNVNKTEYTYDKLGNLVSEVIDSGTNHLNIKTQTTFDANANLLTRQKGDVTDENQSYTIFEIDAFGRRQRQTLDPVTENNPDGLAITTAYGYDLKDRLIKKTDPNGNTQYTLYDVVGKKRFTVDPSGYVEGWRYDPKGQVTQHRCYATAINLKAMADDLTLDALEKQLVQTEEDSIAWYFYDENGCEGYAVNSLGYVKERCYDNALREVKTVFYETPIAITNLDNANLTDIKERITPNSTLDRVTYRIFNEANQLRFVIHPSCAIVEQEFDKAGNVIMTTDYANFIDNPIVIAQLKSEDIRAHLHLNNEQDRVTYKIYDNANRVQFLINGEGRLTYYRYSLENNLVYKAEGFIDGVWPQPYEAIAQQLQKSEYTGERAIEYHYDLANRLIERKDYNGKDDYRFDALGNILHHIDKANSLWQYRYDKAERLIAEISPEVPITRTFLKDGKLEFTELNTSIEKQSGYDKNGNKISVTEAHGLEEAVTLMSTYTPQNQIASTRVEDIVIDDPTLPASFSVRPEKKITLTTEILYNVKGLPIVEKNEKEAWTFRIYDSESRLCYTVDPLKAVVGYRYNAFNDVIEEGHYAITLELDTSLYQKTGISLSIITPLLKESADDRIIKFHYDALGQLIEKQQGPIFYYLPETEIVSGVDVSKTKYIYNAFGDRVSEHQLREPQKARWANTLTWFDRAGQKVATVDAENYVTRYSLNTFGDIDERKELAIALSESPTATLPLSSLDKMLVFSPDDRHTRFEYDKVGLLSQEINVNVTFQSLLIDDAVTSPYQLVDKVHDITHVYTYNVLGKVIHDYVVTETGEGKLHQETLYDKRGFLLGKRGPLLELGDLDSTAPCLTLYGIDALGRTVKEIRYLYGATNTDYSFLPNKPSIDDQITLTLLDKRGLVTYQQDPEGHLSQYTYTKSKKMAREWSSLTNWELKENTYSTITHLDEKQFTYDAVDNVLTLTILRDNVVQESTKTLYNAFNEPIKEDFGKGNWPLFREYDAKGRCWKTNSEDGVTTIILHDLQDRETARLQSPTRHLHEVTYTDLNTLITAPITDIEKTEKRRDNLGRVVVRRLPAYYGIDDNAPLPLPLNMVCSDAYPALGAVSISFLTPEETNVSLQFVLWPKGDESLKKSLPLNAQDGRLGVDVSDFATDVYDYHIHYYLQHPETGITDTKPLYQTKGTLQCVTGHNTGSLHVVVTVSQNTQLQLQGAITDVTAIELWQQGIKLSVIPVKNPIASSLIDLSEYPSGTYQIKPVVKNQKAQPFSLPFRIYTENPAKEPISLELPSELRILTLDTHGQVIWTVPKAFSEKPIKMECTYESTDDKQYQHEDIITPGTDKGHYKDKTGKELICNTEFEKPVKRILKVTLLLELQKDEWVILQQNVLPIIPLQPTKSKRPLKLTEPGWEMVDHDDEWEWVDAPENKALELTTPNSQLAPHLKSPWFLDETEQDIQNFTFLSRLSLYLSPLGGLETPPEILVLDTRKDRLANFITVPATGITAYGVSLDFTGMAVGCYPYQVNVNETAIKGDLWVTEGALVYPSDTLQQAVTTFIQPTRHYVYDAWNNIIEETDTLGYTTKTQYNYFNKAHVILEPSVLVIHENGQSAHMNPVTRYAYDMLGYCIGRVDANNHIRGFGIDDVGHILRQYSNATGVNDITRYDNLGRVYSHTPEQHTWVRRYDRNNHLLSITSPLQFITRYTYNEAGLKTSENNPANEMRRYNYDVNGNIAISFEPLSQAIQYRYDARHQLIEQLNADNSTLSWTRDDFGRVLTHTDISGTAYFYTYDFKGQLCEQRTEKANHGHYYEFVPYTIELFGRRISGYKKEAKPVPNQHLVYTYRTNQLMSVTDKANEKTTAYEYDSEGRRTQLSLTLSDNTVIRQIKTRIDALGREEWTYDAKLMVVTGYDAVGNRRQVNTYYYGDEGKIEQQETAWHAYDEDDRILINGGILENNQIVIKEGKGIEIAYKGHLHRVSETVILNNKRQETVFIYDADDRLSTTQDAIFSTRTYHPAGWLQTYEETTPKKQKRTITCNENGWQLTDVQVENTTVKVDSRYRNFTPLGLAKEQYIIYDNNSIADTLYNDYVGFENWQLTKVGGKRHNKYGMGDYSNADLLYDANGIYSTIIGAEENNQRQLVYLDTTHDGLILKKRYMASEKNPVPTEKRIEYFYTVNGQYLASCEYKKKPGTSDTAIGKMLSRMVLFTGKGELKMASYIQPLNGTLMPSAPLYYTVSRGDTFLSIAQKVFGDSSFAEALSAFAHPGSDQLIPGERITLPQLIPVHNGGNQYRPYQQFMGLMVGAIYPHLEQVIPEPESNLWDTVVEVVVVVVVSIVAPQIGFALGSSLGFTGALATAVNAAGVAALSSAISQGVAIGLGLKEQFSIEAVLKSAVQAGFTAGMIDPSIQEASIAKQIAEYGRAAVTEQLAEMAIGIRSHFNVAGVLGSIASGVANTKLDTTLGYTHSQLAYTDELMRNMIHTASGSVITSAITHEPVHLDELAAQLVGTAVGTYVGNSIVKSFKEEKRDIALQQKTNTESSSKIAGDLGKNTKRRYIKVASNDEIIDESDFNEVLHANNLHKTSRLTRWKTQQPTTKKWTSLTVHEESSFKHNPNFMELKGLDGTSSWYNPKTGDLYRYDGRGQLQHIQDKPIESVHFLEDMFLSGAAIRLATGIFKLGSAALKAFKLGESLFDKKAETVNLENPKARILNNISKSQGARNNSNFLVLAAKENQISSAYNPDYWSMINLNKGDIVYGGLPGQSYYYTSERTLLASGHARETLFKSLQVKPDLELGYRPEVGMYEVTQNVRVPTGIVAANPALGIGGGDQFFINNFSRTLRLTNIIKLEERYEYMPTYRPYT